MTRMIDCVIVIRTQTSTRSVYAMINCQHRFAIIAGLAIGKQLQYNKFGAHVTQQNPHI